MNIRSTLLGLAAAAWLAGCATKPPESLAGNYSMRAPDGTTSAVTVAALREQEYYLRAPGEPVSGVYRFANDELRITKPDNPRMSGYVWRKEASGAFVLVEEPTVPVSGKRLTSATLTRAP
jgi:hypothetical protein